METLTGTIQFIQYYNPDNGFSILKILPEMSLMVETAQVKILEPTVGMVLRLTGEWVDSKFGKQFSAIDWEEVMPSSLIGIEGYLSSGLIKGIGPIYAKKIVSTFGTSTFDVLNNTPERLKEVSGIGTKRCAEIIESWTKQQSVRNLMIFLKHYEISTKNVIKIHRMYGDDAIAIIKENPYRLVDNIEGIGFKIVDNIGLNIGIEMDDPRRVQCGIKYVMIEMCEAGDTYCIADEISTESEALMEVDEETVIKNIDDMIAIGSIVDDEGRLYLKHLYDAEINVAKKLREMAETIDVTLPAPPPIEVIEERTGVHYEDEQKEALYKALTERVMILTGGPGTGKTTVVRGIIEMLSMMGMRIACAAPTGKAAKRMEELTGRQAMTIHRLLGYNPGLGFTYNAMHPLEDDVLILDEVSMVNLLLMDTLLAALPQRIKLIMVGDADQLPCIGSGNVLKDCIESHTLTVVKMDKIYRQAAGSNIIKNAHRIKNGEPIVVSNTSDSDFFLLNRDDDILEEVVDLAVRRLPLKYGGAAKDIQVITPMKKCAVGVDALNVALQKAINPEGVEIKRGNTTFRVGDKVMQTVNDYDLMVFNGDCGYIESIDTESKTTYVRYSEDAIPVAYSYPYLDELQLAYAMTIHKSQGSEYPIVVIPITYANKRMMQRNLLYTAITRAKNLCVIIGDRRLVEKAVMNTSSYERKTMLARRLIFRGNTH